MKIERVEVFGVAVPLIGSGSLARPATGVGVTLDESKIARYRFEAKATV